MSILSPFSNNEVHHRPHYRHFGQKPNSPHRNFQVKAESFVIQIYQELLLRTNSGRSEEPGHPWSKTLMLLIQYRAWVSNRDRTVVVNRGGGLFHKDNHFVASLQGVSCFRYLIYCLSGLLRKDIEWQQECADILGWTSKLLETLLETLLLRIMPAR